MIKTINTLIFVLAMIGNISFADAVNIEFEAPTSRVDGTPLTVNEIKNFTVFVDGALVKTVPNTATQYSIDLNPGNYIVTMITVDTDGRESQKSVEKSINVLSTPLPPIMGVISVTVEVVIK